MNSELWTFLSPINLCFVAVFSSCTVAYMGKISPMFVFAVTVNSAALMVHSRHMGYHFQIKDAN